MTKKILIVEDEEVIASMVKDNLEVRGYEVVVAYSGIEGLRKAEAHSPDLIALDVMMPGLDGITVLRRLKANEITKDIPVIVLSIAEGYKDKGLELGAAAFVKKPFNFNDLTDKIRAFTDKKSILVVDDNQETLELIESRLNIIGFDVLCVQGEEDLFKNLKRKKPDIILMDIVLQNSDGLEIIRRLKGIQEYSGIPIIAFSGYVFEGLSEGEIAGIDRYVEGEFNINNLIKEVRNQLES